MRTSVVAGHQEWAGRTGGAGAFSRLLPEPSTSLDRRALRAIRDHVASARLRFVLWDGYGLSPATTTAVSTIAIKNRRTLYGLLWNPELNFGEAYMFGGLDIRGDLVATLEAIYRALGPVTARRWWWPDHVNGLGRARDNVHHHYDLGNDFYRLWLDREMLYTCAYFAAPSCALEDAQMAKMERVCRKLRLRAGEQVVEAGSGWGALARYMALRYGATVRAFNVSAEQVAYARERARLDGVADRVEFVEDDYRNITGRYDVFVSVGMLEHVGVADYATLGGVMDRALGPNGRGLLHFIGRNQRSALNPWIRRRIFPGAYTPTLSEVVEGVLEPQGFSVVDVENLRLHYAATLDHWRRRFEAASDHVRRMFDETFVRAWGLYLAGSQAAFTTGAMQFFQVAFARGGTNDIPWTRDEHSIRHQPHCPGR